MTEHRDHDLSEGLEGAVAILGMAGRFPGAPDLKTLWHNLRAGVEGLTRFSEEELRAAGLGSGQIEDARRVPVGGPLEGADRFDADFFQLAPSQAQVLDPQQRLFLECAWQALEASGCDPSMVPGPVGVYAGSGVSTYMLQLLGRAGALENLDHLSVLTGNDKDYLASRVAFHLDLRGPAVGVQTACSTSLVAVHLARENLLSGEVDLALAGGVTVLAEPRRGYLYQEGGILSPDGRCRPFDAAGAGTLFTSGVGVVVLKRLEDALEDGDPIRAVIRGSAVNNDGALKVGFTAPSVRGQREVIQEALAEAGVEAGTVGYVEAHGTATPLGDPIEVRALTEAFGDTGREPGFCALGSIKALIGHTDAAAGIAGLIKSVLALEHGELPPSPHFERANPEIPLEKSPFYVPTEPRPWPRETTPRRAGVSSFGLGGTNAHLVLEEAPDRAASRPSEPWQLLVLSARSQKTLVERAQALRTYLEDHPETELADIAFTLWSGRRPFEHRRALVCRDRAHALELLGREAAVSPVMGGDSAVPRAQRLTELGQAWQAGEDVDREALFGGKGRQKLSLPTYPFERRRFWLDPPTGDGGEGDELPSLEGQLYAPRWTSTALPESLAESPKNWLLFVDEEGLGQSLAQALRGLGHRVSTASVGQDFADSGDGAFRLDPRQGEHFERLLATLATGPGAPQAVVHLWSRSPMPLTPQDELDRGFFALLHLARALATHSPEPPRLTLVASGLESVSGGEGVVPARAAALGPLRVLPLEVSGLRATALDLPQAEATVERLLAELLAADPDALVAWREGERLLPHHEPLPKGAPFQVREGGVFLITGGFGGLGGLFAKRLAQASGARLALLGRTPLPPRDAWPSLLADEGTAATLRRRLLLVERLEEQGAEVLPLAVDVADKAAVDAAVQMVRQRWGTIHGVVHAAGVDGGGPVHQRTVSEASEVLRPKVEGTLNLSAALDGTPLDFYLLCSSTAALLGALHQVDYAAANAFLDAFAGSSAAPSGTVSVAWDAWHDLGLTASQDGATTALHGGGALRREEGLALFEAALGARTPRVVASKRDLPALLERSRELLRSSPNVAPSASGPRHPRPDLAAEYVAPRTESERALASLWQEVLGLERVGVNDLFFDLGGDSLLLMTVRNRLRQRLGIDVPMPRLFRFPTVAALATDLEGRRGPAAPARGSAPSLAPKPVTASTPRASGASVRAGDIAIIGRSGRFPGAKNIAELWSNLAEGVESIPFFDEEELLAAGLAPETLENPAFVRAKPLLEGAADFDNTFFGISAREAEGLDPQHRIFLETAWEAFEDAGYDPRRLEEEVGVFAGAAVSQYPFHLMSNPEVAQNLGTLQLVLGNDKDYLPTRVSFKLDLKGPSVNVQSACSTSLIAVHLACRAILEGECGMALAGGVALAGYVPGGYASDGGSMLSPDGHCRPFDARAQGTIFGSGSGAVLLKSLDRALADGDTVYAVIKGTAINNDGANKVGYTAPGVDGQRRVIHRALEVAGLGPEAVRYVEAHGTATQLGDPIEVAALNEVFGGLPERSCALGSIKSNIGHADAAAGIAGLLKAVLALEHRRIPASLHFESPNPEIHFEDGPFYVNERLAEWPPGEGPLRAGVSAFGIGGSNAHIVVEEAPERAPSSASRTWQTLHLSARSPDALNAMAKRLADHLEAHPEEPLADVAYTLEVGRRTFPHRRALAARDGASAVQALRGEPAEGALGPFGGVHEGALRRVVFLFPGQGAQYIDMGRELYATEPVFRRELDRCAEGLESHLGLDLRELLFPSLGTAEDPEEAAEAAATRLQETRYTQPALFAVEWALAQQWMAWGVLPEAMVGHSIGEWVAACLADVVSLDDALAIVAARGRLMHGAAPGAMLSVPLDEVEVEALLAEQALGEELSIAAINGPGRLVVAGPFEAMARLEAALAARGVSARRLVTSHAFHSALMDPILDDFRTVLEGVELRAPQRIVLSGVTGRPLSAAEAQDPAYWLRQLRRPVRFADALETACSGGEALLLEVGPGRTLSSLARRIPAAEGVPAIASMRHPREWASDQAYLLAARGRLWLAGESLDSAAFFGEEERRRVPLPTYPFERQRFFVEMKPGGLGKSRPRRGRRELDEWFHVPTWKPSDASPGLPERERYAPCLVFADTTGLADALVPRLRRHLGEVLTVRAGEGFSATENDFTVKPGSREDLEALLRALWDAGRWPKSLLFAWGVSAPPEAAPGRETPELKAHRQVVLERGVYTLFHLAQLLEQIGGGEPLRLLVLSNGIHPVTGSEVLEAEKATLAGAYMVIPQEYRNVSCHGIDLELAADWEEDDELLHRLVEELANERAELAVAYRRGRRFVEAYEAVPLAERQSPRPMLRQGGCYLVTGGLGGLGLLFARHLARRAQARLVLTSRSGLPPRETWEEVLATRSSEDSKARRIRSVLELEEVGAEVLVVAADVSDEAAMAEALDIARERFGPLHGVFHAAGLPSGSLIQTKELKVVEETLAPKVRGTRVLESLLAEDPLELFFLFSSTGSVLGGLGYFDYGAANAFLDAFAAEGDAPGRRRLAVNWGAFQEVGMAVASNMGFTSEEERRLFLSQAIHPDEGLEAFDRLLARPFPRLVVWPQDLDYALEQSRLLATVEEDPAEKRASHPRPAHLTNELVEPTTERERELLGLWQELMGIEEIGVRDDFFELGADSLLATQMLSRIRRLFGISLTLDQLYQGPTIEGLARTLDEGQPEEQEALDELASLLDEVEGLSEEEIDLEMATEGES